MSNNHFKNIHINMLENYLFILPKIKTIKIHNKGLLFLLEKDYY